MKEGHYWLFEGSCIVPGEGVTELATGYPVLNPAGHAPLALQGPGQTAGNSHRIFGGRLIQAVDEDRETGTGLTDITSVRALDTSTTQSRQVAESDRLTKTWLPKKYQVLTILQVTQLLRIAVPLRP
ncbi:hypothetical protein D9M68_628730 [compost metagenome]